MPECSLKDLDGRIARFRALDAKAPSDGVSFNCPSCPPERRHKIAVNWSGPSIVAGGDLWKLESAPDVAALTLSPSINCDVGRPDGCRFHGWVRKGIVQW